MKVRTKLDNLLNINKLNLAPTYQFDVMGKKINVPVKYSNSSAFMALFPISIAKAKEILATKRLEPVSIFNGKCLLGITIFDYIECPIGPYREIALSIPVKLDQKISVPFLPLILDPLLGRSSFYTIILAMNTPIAKEHSEKIFGYPTYHGNIEIDIKEEEESVSIDSKEGNERILSLKIKKLNNFKIAKNKYNTYFVKNNKLIKVELHAATYEAESGGKNDSVLSLGNHEISNILKKLCVESQPLRTIYYANLIEILNSPKEVGGI